MKTTSEVFFIWCKLGVKFKVRCRVFELFDDIIALFARSAALYTFFDHIPKKCFSIVWISKNFFVEKSPSPKKYQLSFIISKVIISRSAPPFPPKQGLSSSIPPGKFNFYNEIVTSFCIFFNLSDRFSYLKKEPPSFRESMSTKYAPNPLGEKRIEKPGKTDVYQMSTKHSPKTTGWRAI